MDIEKKEKQIVEAINEIESNREYSIQGHDINNIVWHDLDTKDEISKEDIEAKISELEQQKIDKKESGRQKLKDLGLDDDEINALTN